MEFNLWHVGAIVAVGFAQGFLNIVAGGGAFLVLPMLTFLGMDLAMANGTNRIAILLQSVSGATSFHRDKILSLRSALPLALVLAAGPLLVPLAVGVFVVAWVFQFIGHKIEGKKPSFFEDIQYLWVGPLFVLAKLLARLGLRW